MDQKKIGKYIAEKRKLKNLTQIQLGEMLNVGNKAVSKWERGVSLPDVSKYQELCDILGISLNEFFAGEDLEDINIIQRSEENIIGVARLGKNKNRKLFKTVILLLICIGILATALIWFISKEHLLMGDYIISYAQDDPKAAALVAEYGNATTLFSYSLDNKYKFMDVELKEYRYGELTDICNTKVELPEYRGKKSMFGITPELDEGEFKITCSFDGGITFDNVPISTGGIDVWAEWAGYSIQTIEKCRKIEVGKQIPIYVYMTGKDQLTVPEGFANTVNQPEERLDSTELCYVMYVTFE